MRATFDHSDPQTNSIVTFWLRPEKPVGYTAGQYIELTLPHQHPDKRGQKRWFTLSSPPGHQLVSITTRYAGDKTSSSFKKTLFHLEPGHELTMSEPMGDFVLPKDSSQPLLFVAGGIGITPFHSMLEWLAEHHERRPITFIYGVHNEDDIMFEDTCRRAGVHATIIVSEPSSSWGGERGQLSAEVVRGLATITSATLVYLSGPEPMIEHLTKDLKASGLPERQLVTDFFPGYTAI